MLVGFPLALGACYAAIRGESDKVLGWAGVLILIAEIVVLVAVPFRP